jgi:signal transduction histidine kinase
VIFVAALPATFIAVVLAAYFLLLRYADAEKELLDRGHSLIGLLTPAAEYGVFSGNREELQQLAAALSRASDIQSVIIYDGKGFLLAQVGQPNPTLDPEALEDGWSNRSENGDTQYFHAKIWRTALQIDDPLTWAGKARPGKEAIGSIFIAMSRADVLVRKQEMMAVTLIATLVTLGLAALLALRLSRDVSAPILALQQVVERIRGGHLETRAARHPAQTLRGLEDGINDMAVALQAGRDHLENRIAQATAELQQKKDEAEQASIAKSRFLAAASHDLRQPLHALVLFSADLMSKADSTSMRRLAGQINAAIASLGELLDGLLDFSRVDLGAARPELQAVGLDELLERVVATHRNSAQVKGLQLRRHPTRSHVLSDSLLLYRMVSNLVANAVRYTERGGILIGVRRSADRVRIEVWDSGIGITDAHRSLIFQEFFQAGNPERNPGKGLGLGLSLVERLARLLDHSLSVRSVPGSGSVFGISLPRCPAGNANPSCDTGNAAQAAGDFDASLLIVGVQEGMCASLCKQLAAWGCRITCARTAIDAIEAMGLSDGRPDLILCEGQGCDEAPILLKAMAGSGPPSPLILLGHPDVDAKSWPIGSRVTCLSKPIRPAKLRALMHHLLREDASRSEGIPSAA